MLIFKRLDKLLKYTKVELSQVDLVGDELEFLKAKLVVLEKIQEYLHSYSWLSHKKYKDRVALFLASNYDYRGCADNFNSNLNTFETSMSYAGKKFSKSIGDSTLTLIEQGNIEAAYFQFQIASNSLTLSSFLASEVLSMIPSPSKDITVSLSTCVDELKFFKQVSLPRLRNFFSTLDPIKLAHLRYILEVPDPRYADDRARIIKYILMV